MIVLDYVLAATEADVRREAAALRDRMLRELCGIDSPVIKRTASGKPYLVKDAGISFSVSHSGRLALCAVSFPGVARTARGTVLWDGASSPEVGADAEKVRPAEQAARLRKIAERFFPPSEIRLLRDAADTDVPQVFARSWTLCESYVKMTGEGFGAGFGALDFAGIISPCFCVQDGEDMYILRAAWREKEGGAV